jgi:hypothetical protein
MTATDAGAGFLSFLPLKGGGRRPQAAGWGSARRKRSSKSLRGASGPNPHPSLRLPGGGIECVFHEGSLTGAGR